jgi:hypothetical protein
MAILMQNGRRSCELSVFARGLYISKVFKNTLFHKVGIQEGDMLYQVNKHNLGLYGDIKIS